MRKVASSWDWRKPTPGLKAPVIYPIEPSMKLLSSNLKLQMFSWYLRSLPKRKLISHSDQTFTSGWPSIYGICKQWLGYGLCAGGFFWTLHKSKEDWESSSWVIMWPGRELMSRQSLSGPCIRERCIRRHAFEWFVTGEWAYEKRRVGDKIMKDHLYWACD